MYNCFRDRAVSVLKSKLNTWRCWSLWFIVVCAVVFGTDRQVGWCFSQGFAEFQPVIDFPSVNVLDFASNYHKHGSSDQALMDFRSQQHSDSFPVYLSKSESRYRLMVVRNENRSSDSGTHLRFREVRLLTLLQNCKPDMPVEGLSWSSTDIVKVERDDNRLKFVKCYGVLGIGNYPSALLLTCPPFLVQG